MGEKGQGVESVKEVRCAHEPHNGAVQVDHRFSVLGLPKEKLGKLLGDDIIPQTSQPPLTPLDPAYPPSVLKGHIS